MHIPYTDAAASDREQCYIEPAGQWFCDAGYTELQGRFAMLERAGSTTNQTQDIMPMRAK